MFVRTYVVQCKKLLYFLKDQKDRIEVVKI